MDDNIILHLSRRSNLSMPGPSRSPHVGLDRVSLDIPQGPFSVWKKKQVKAQITIVV